MFTHVMVGVSDIETSKRFYDAIFATLDLGPGVDNKGRYFYISPGGVFAITVPIDGAPPTRGNGSTIGFKVESAQQGDAWHSAGVANGGSGNRGSAGPARERDVPCLSSRSRRK